MNHLQSSRLQSVDVVRLFAIFAVVVIHTMPFDGVYISLGRELNVGYLLNQLARFAVPFFFVVSGYFWGLKISSGSPIVDSTKQMAKRISKLFFAWSAIYLMPTNLLDTFQHGELGPLKQIYWNLSNLFNNPVRTVMEGTKVHLWFLVALLFCLAISAILINRKKGKALIFLSIVLYGVGLLGKAYADSPIGFYSDFNFRNGPFFGLIFFVTGFTLSGMAQRKSWLTIGVVFAIVGTLMHFAELFLLRGLWGTTMLQDFVIGTYFMGVGVALIALSNPKFLRFDQLSKVGPLVLGVYAVHFVFVDLFRPFQATLKGVAWWGFGYPIGVFVMSIATAYAMSRFRLTRQFVA